MSPVAFEVQQQYALKSGLRTEIIWDLLLEDQAHILKEKLKILWPDKSNSKLEKQRENIFENVWSQRIYTNRNLLSAIIYVLVAENTKNLESALYATNFTHHVVIRTRKCIVNDNSGANLSCCMIFVDELGRVYKNWNDYLQNNNLPKGIMVVPKQGIYTFDEIENVKLECYRTPATEKELSVVDKIVTMGSKLTIVPLMASLAMPIPKAVMVAAEAMNIACAAHSVVGSVKFLVDRFTHSQTISPLEDREVLKNWMSVASVAVGLGARRASSVAVRAAAENKKLGSAAKVAIYGINTISIITADINAAINFYDLLVKYNDKQEIKGLDLTQFAATLIIFTHSVNNMKIAKAALRIGKSNAMNNEINAHMRKSLDELTNNAPRFHHNSDIIRTFNDINNNCVFSGYCELRLNGNLSRKRVDEINKKFEKYYFEIDSSGNPYLNLVTLAENFGMSFVKHVRDYKFLATLIVDLCHHFSKKIANYLISLASEFLERNCNNYGKIRNIFISTEKVLLEILKYVKKANAKRTAENILVQSNNIIQALHKYFNSLNPINNNVPKIKCKDCNGSYSKCQL